MVSPSSSEQYKYLVMVLKTQLGSFNLRIAHFIQSCLHRQNGHPPKASAIQPSGVLD